MKFGNGDVVMSFKEEFKNLVAKSLKNKGLIDNEQTTKQSLIVPFINLLGYETTNPLDVCSEYSAGFDKAKEKVDYALFKKGKIVLFIEAKNIKDPLKKHDPQLSKYFNSTPEAKFAVITNGIKYRFYTDLIDKNIIDPSPFFELDFEKVTDNDIGILQNFSKELFNVNTLVPFAEQLVYYSKIKIQIVQLLRNPSDELIRLILKEHFVNIKSKSSVIDRFRVLVKNAITDALIEIFRQGIMQNDVSQAGKMAGKSQAEKKNFELTETIKHKKPGLPKMDILFDWGLIKTGDFVFLKNSLTEKAKVIDCKTVKYNGQILSFNQWGLIVRGC